MKSNSFALFLLFCYSSLCCQIDDNDYFEVLYSCSGKGNKMIDAGDENFLIVDNKTSFLLNSKNRVKLPCSNIKFESLLKNRDYFYCYVDSTVSVYSVSPLKKISQDYEFTRIISENFYATKIDSTASLYNFQNERLLDLHSDKTLEQLFHFYDEEHIRVSMIKRKDDILVDLKGKQIKDFNLYSLKKPIAENRYLFYKEGKLGLRDKNDEIILTADFDKIEATDHNTFVACKNLKRGENGFTEDQEYCGLFSEGGKEILPMNFTRLWSYEYGMTASKENCKTTFLNNSYENVYDREFDVIVCYRSGFIKFEDEGQLLYDFVYDSDGWNLKDGISQGKSLSDKFTLLTYNDGNQVLMNNSGETIFNADYKEVKFKWFRPGLIKITSGFETGIIDAEGHWFLEMGNYSIPRYFKNQGGFVRSFAENKQTILCNEFGEEIIRDVRNASVVSTDYHYILSRNLKVGVVDTLGKILIPFEYERISEMRHSPGYYTIKDKEHRYLVKLKP